MNLKQQREQLTDTKISNKHTDTHLVSSGLKYLFLLLFSAFPGTFHCESLCRAPFCLDLTMTELNR